MQLITSNFWKISKWAKTDYQFVISIVEEAAAAKAEAAAKDLSTQQAVAVLGLALVAMGEDIGSEMLFRHFGHLLRYLLYISTLMIIIFKMTWSQRAHWIYQNFRYCEPVIRRAVPLALGLISVSNPQLNILDTLSKFSHDADAEVRDSFLKYDFKSAQIQKFTLCTIWKLFKWLFVNLTIGCT